MAFAFLEAQFEANSYKSFCGEFEDNRFSLLIGISHTLSGSFTFGSAKPLMSLPLP